MKNIIISFVVLFATLTTFAQKKIDWPSYFSNLRLTGSKEGTDMGSYITSEKNASLSWQGAYGRIGYSVGFDYQKQEFDLALCFAKISESNNKVVTMWAVGPGTKLILGPNAQSLKNIFFGGKGFINIEKEKSFEIEIGGSYLSKHKDSGTAWNLSVVSIDAEGVMKIGQTFRIGLSLGYNVATNNEPKPKNDYQNQYYFGRVLSRSILEGGLFLGAGFNSDELGSFSIDAGPKIKIGRHAYEEIGVQKNWKGEKILCDWWLRLTYHFKHIRN